MKRKYIIIISTLIVFAFVLQYYFITTYIEKMFQYTAIDVKNEFMKKEIEEFKIYLLESFIFLFFQSLGMFLCLNIGFLYFKIKISFRNILNIVVSSFLVIAIYQFLVICIIKFNHWTFTIVSIDSASEKLNLGHYLSLEKTLPWISSSLTIINLEQLLILLVLGVSIHRILKINYKKAFSITVRTYGIGVLLWFVFVMVMEMNFS